VYNTRVRLTSLVLLLAVACNGATASSDSDDPGTTSAATSPTDGGEVDFDCAGYCTQITAHCVGEHAQYPNLQTCMSTCADFDMGEQADRTGNTLGCRLYHAGAAADAPETHCTHAGPGGNGQCGTNCQGFCTVGLRACPAIYSDEAACLSTCAGFDDSESFDASDLGGDTLACRLYHLTVATMFPVDHCPHIAADSDPCR